MSIFGRGKGGGLMNVIRCDEENYLVWKWRPEGQEVNSTTRENSIRYGSSLRVKDGEVAVFVYMQQNATLQDFIEGPYDQTIKTGNFPVLANLVGMAWGGESPFQAEVYFINLQGNNQVRFGIPYFDVFDPRLPDHGIPVSVRGTLTFNITDYRGFIKLNRLVNFDLDKFLEQIRAAISKYVKNVVANIPHTMNIPLVQMETQLLDINQKVQGYLSSRLEEDFGVNLKALDISAIEIDKDSPYYAEVRQLTAGNTARTMNAQTDVNIQNLKDMQAINTENVAESLRIQREEAQRAQRLQSETNFLGAHSIDKQAEVLKAAAESLGQMGTMNMGGGDGGGLNPAGMMTGMMMGGAMGQQMAGMMSQMGQAVQGGMNTPPPIPNVQYFMAVNGQQAGPFTIQQLQLLVGNGQLTKRTYVWKQGMANWDFAENIAEVAALFVTNTPPPPPPPVP
jgi:membrane protease subunit (stomatin/prohibitin family)